MTARLTFTRFLAASLAAVVLCLSPGAWAQSAAAKAIFDEYWERTAQFFPDQATERGDHRFDDRLPDASPEGEAPWYAYLHELERRLAALPRESLAREDRLSVDILLGDVRNNLAQQRIAGLRTMTVVAAPWPYQTWFLNLLQEMPVATEAQVANVFARMAAYPKRMDQEIAWLREGIRLGWVPPKIVLQQVLVQLDGQLAKHGEASPYFEPFQRLGPDIPPARRDALRRQGVQAVERDAMGPTRKLRDFVAGEYMAAAPERVGVSQYPQGPEAYALLVRQQTSTDLSPEDIHRIGLAQVAKERDAMEAVRREVGFQGDLAAFMKYLNTDPRFFKRSGEELLSGYRDVLKRIDPELPRLFAVLPRAPYGVRPLPDFMGPGSAETYSGPALDGSRPGWFNANTLGYANRPVWSMEAISLHEGVPGHHLQTARAAELTGVPDFRRAAFFTAYAEGWALYSETLGFELGMYKDPYSRFGFHSYQAWRAARLVVDTGLHAKGWTREQAIDYLSANTGTDRTRTTAEVDRYISWPGQALSYMIGELKIIELRDKAKRALGDRFDLRRFHNVLLDEGQLPLDLLERVVDDWIAAEKAR